MEQQNRHHAARVVERERVWIVDAHRALDRLAADVQVANAARLAHRERRGALHAAAARVRRISTSTMPAAANESAAPARIGAL